VEAGAPESAGLHPALGLTISCEVGYELAELGQLYLDASSDDEAGAISSELDPGAGGAG
jgi:hypothetical protein